MLGVQVPVCMYALKLVSPDKTLYGIEILIVIITVHVCMHACVCVCVCKHGYLCVRVCMCACMHRRVHTPQRGRGR